MKLSPRYGTHLPALLQALARTSGPVLELGMGAYSTPILHAVCELEGRELVSIDNDSRIWLWGVPFSSDRHLLVHTNNWDRAPIDRDWDVVLVDHSPGERRVVEIRRLANRARYLIVHDTNRRYEKEYHYSTIWPLFQYRLDFANSGLSVPSTTILSNFEPLTDFWGKWKHQPITF